MQIPLRTQSSTEAYIAGHEWRDACLPACPLHPSGGCSFARHGSYARVTPQGVRVARWYCPEGHQTFSLLPDFLASRLPGLLTDIEIAAAESRTARSMEAAADRLRGFEVTLPSALRWLRRRVRAVEVAFEAVSRLAHPAAVTVLASSSTLRPVPGAKDVLLGLRRSLSSQLLHSLPVPLGFRPSRSAHGWHGGNQHDMGPDGYVAAYYAAVFHVRHSPCNPNPPIHCQTLSSRRPRTSSVFGMPIAACRTAAPTCTCSGSGGSVRTARSADSRSKPS